MVIAMPETNEIIFRLKINEIIINNGILIPIRGSIPNNKPIELPTAILKGEFIFSMR
jgi:hypothetical protein